MTTATETVVENIAKYWRETKAWEKVYEIFRKPIVDIIRKLGVQQYTFEDGMQVTVDLQDFNRRKFKNPVDVVRDKKMSPATALRLCQFSAGNVDAALKASLITQETADYITTQAETDPYGGVKVMVKEIKI